MAAPNAYASLAYRRVSTEHSSPVARLVALYDTLCGDLQRASEAMRRGEIEPRCRQLKHGFSVLTQLDAMLDTENGGATALKLRRFYGYLRRLMLDAQFKLNPEMLDRAAKYVLDTRAAWLEVQAREEAKENAAQSVPSGEPLSFEA